MLQDSDIKPTTDHVYVTRVLKSDDEDNCIFSPDRYHAEAYWRGITERALGMVGKKRVSITTQMHQLDLSDQDAAIRAVHMGQSEIIKALTIRPAKNLLTKVVINGPGAINAEMLIRAEVETREMLLDQFFERMTQDVTKLQFYRKVIAQDCESVVDHIDEIFRICYQLSGRGGLFDYGLLACIAGKTCWFILDRISISSKYVQLLIIHLDMIKLIICRRLEGDGGELGSRLTQNLTNLHQSALKDQQILAIGGA